jgi:hypothetical protein
MAKSLDSKEFYKQSGRMTGLTGNKLLVEDLPKDIPTLVSIVQGLIIHQWLTWAYKIDAPSQDRSSAVQIRPAEGILDRILLEDNSPLTKARSPSDRLPGNCRQFTVVLTALLRAQGTPARARCGFGCYFGTKASEDHWVCEYWNAEQQRWILVDAQIDATQRGIFPIDFDPLDVPRDKFLVAGAAWTRYRSGDADQTSFAISPLNESGAWLVAQNMIRDFAALNKMEMLPWDIWGAMPPVVKEVEGEQLVFFDRLAMLAVDPDGKFSELRELYEEDDRFRVPSSVYNHSLSRDEHV